MRYRDNPTKNNLVLWMRSINMGVCKLDSDGLPQPTDTVVHPPFALNIENLTKASVKLGSSSKAKREKFHMSNIEEKKKTEAEK